MNEIFYQKLMENTSNTFELIVVDNKSNDGSSEFFATKSNVKYIENNGNYNYPYCQNIGLKNAKFEYLCFFNNDIIVSPKWDIKILELFKNNNNLSVLSVASNDHIENQKNQKKLAKKWKWIKYPLQYLLGNSKFSLNLMIKLMYGDFNKFAEKRFLDFGYKLIEGYSGSAIIIKKHFFDLLEMWDERIQAADYDLFNRVKKISYENKTVLPIQLALGVYFHHYQKLTLKTKYPPFENKSNMISLYDKWGNETNELRKNIIS